MKNLQTPLPTIKRIPAYLKLLNEFENNEEEWISTTMISERLNLKPIQIRKDMAFTGIIGQPKKGYPVKELKNKILTFLGWNNATDAFLVGCGGLGSALLGYKGFETHGLNIVGAFDSNPDKIGSLIHGKTVMDISKLGDLAKRMFVKIGIITVPEKYAQQIADLMVEAGIKAIWNFAPVKLNLPNDVCLQMEDLSEGLAVLSVKLKHAIGEE